MKNFEIKNRLTNEIIFKGKFENFKSCVEKAVKGVILSSADLIDADLRDADLMYSNLRGSDLRDSKF